MSDNLQKHTLNLFPGDYQRLMELFPDIGAGSVIRRLVHQYLEGIDAADEAKVPRPEIEI